MIHTFKGFSIVNEAELGVFLEFPWFLHDPDNHGGVITHLEPDILECEVKWALWSITTKKTSGGGRIPAELLQTLKDDDLEYCTQ